MFITTHGSFRGDMWENACQVCFKLKYSDSYSEVKATSPGDHGIEGFTRTGKVFQCYCPDENYNPDKNTYTPHSAEMLKDVSRGVIKNHEVGPNGEILNPEYIKNPTAIDLSSMEVKNGKLVSETSPKGLNGEYMLVI